MTQHLLRTVLALSALGAYAQQKPIILKPEEVLYEGKGVKTAWVSHRQDRSTADAFIRWPAGVMEGGKAEASSTHPFSVRIAVIEGTVVFQFAEGEVKELKAGSYIYAPAAMKHYLGCKAGGPECVMFAVFAPDPTAPK